MADVQVKQEFGAALMFIGLALWVADLLVVFYLPAALKLGGEASFYAIIAVLGIAGLLLMLRGYWQRVRSGAGE